MNLIQLIEYLIPDNLLSSFAYYKNVPRKRNDKCILIMRIEYRYIINASDLYTLYTHIYTYIQIEEPTLGKKI